MRFILPSLLLECALVLVLAGCQGQKAFPESPGQQTQAPRNWAGSYRGIVPCADCGGIEIMVRLSPDGSYELSTTYLGKATPAPSHTRGRFRWRPGGREVELDGREWPNHFRVEQNRLRVLDQRGAYIHSGLSDRYLLRKTGN